jgi:hypothetical protein
MTTNIRTAAAAAALLAAFTLPLAAQAASTTSGSPQHYALQTRIVDRYHAGEFDGALTMTIYPSGIVQGTYRPADGGFRTVTGGIEGTAIWLDIGMNHPLHLTGTFKDGVLRAVAQIPGPDVYTFESTNVSPSGA